MKLGKLSAFGIVLASGIQFAHAQTVNFAQSYTQTGASTIVLNGYSAAEQAFQSNLSASPVTAQVTRPNGTVDALTPGPIPGALFQYLNFPTFSQLVYASSQYTSLASFNSDWGLGGYTFAGTNLGGDPYSMTEHNTGTDWTPTPAMVTNYADLAHGVNPATGVAVDFTTFNPYLDNGLSTFGYTTISLWDLTTDSQVAYSNLQDASTSSWYLGANAVDHNYQVVIADEQIYYDHTGNGALAYFDVTTVNFQTTPEPAPFAVMGLGIFGLLIRRRSRR